MTYVLRTASYVPYPKYGSPPLSAQVLILPQCAEDFLEHTFILLCLYSKKFPTLTHTKPVLSPA
jgi:hypothetical protein